MRDHTQSIPLDRSEGDLNLTPPRAAWQRSHVDEAACSLLSRDSAAYIHQALSTPCLNAIERCEGPWIIDTAGRKILDFHGNSAHQVGYGHPRVIDAVKRQLESLSFCPRRYTNRPAIDLAERLGRLSPGGELSKVLLAPGGATAVGIALKIARAATGRHETASFRGSFHGATLDTISIGGEEIFRGRMGQLLPGAHLVPPPIPRLCSHRCQAHCNGACADDLETFIRSGRFGAVIAEPIRCTTVDPAPVGYWRRIREACDRAGTLLIFDEIPIALGRTGRMWACEHDGVIPDILVLGKGLGGAVFPLAAVLARPHLDCHPAGALGHYTHEKSPLGAAAALATLDILRDEGLVDRSARLGQAFIEGLRSLQRRHPVIREVRGRGLLVGVELGPRADQTDPVLIAERVMYAALSRGLSFKVSGGTVLTLTPPLNIDTRLLDQAVEIIDASLTEVAAA